jgi:hypothetical protein
MLTTRARSPLHHDFLDQPELGGIERENAASASIFLADEHVDVPLGCAAVRKPGAHAPKMPHASKFRATKPGIEGAEVLAPPMAAILADKTARSSRSAAEAWPGPI